MSPKSQREDVIASFTGQKMVPISWCFLFSPEEMKKRREEFPNQIKEFEDKESSLDVVENFMEDPVAFKTSLPDAKQRLAEYREAFESIPYIWSYFKVIDILDKQLEEYIEQLEEEPEATTFTKSRPHPETNLSQVKVDERAEQSAISTQTTSETEEMTANKTDKDADIKSADQDEDEDDPFANIQPDDIDDLFGSSSESTKQANSSQSSFEQEAEELVDLFDSSPSGDEINQSSESTTGQEQTQSSTSSPGEMLTDTDNPFSELEDFGEGAEVQSQDTQSSSEQRSDSDLSDLNDDGLLTALETAAQLDMDQFDEPVEEEPVKEEDLFMPVIVYFDKIASDGRGNRISEIPLLLNRLLHHAQREEEMTRVMQDLLQEIFREALSGWRITGQLAEDFVQSDPDDLADIMLGQPSPYVIINESLDLKYWTRGTLQSGDERLMYSLTMLPSEEIHIAIKSGRLDEIAPRVGNLLVSTQSKKFPRLNIDIMEKPPLETNVWGFRVLIRDTGGDFKPATLLISDPSISWKDEFEDRINLPGVLEDWNVEFPIRFEEFSDIDHYRVVFEGARDMEDTFGSFVRWARRHHIMYKTKFGVKGTIDKLKSILEETEDKQLGMLIFNILTDLTELGFDTAMEALSDEAVVRKLPWLYS